MGPRPPRPRPQRPARDGGGGALPDPCRSRVGHLQAPLAGADRQSHRNQIRYMEWPPPAMTRTILGYADRFSVAPGEKIAFKVSCEGHAHYHLEIVRLISGDLSPDGPGFREEVVPSGIAGNYPGRHQAIAAGSYAVVPDSPMLHGLGQGA